MGLAKRYWCFLGIIISTSIVSGQNLVPNSGFEKYHRLPCAINEHYIQDLLFEWIQPIPTTTDYWNNLSDTSCFLTTQNLPMKPRSGDGVVGLVSLARSEQSKNEFKEYAEVKLKEQLIVGNFYCGEFFTLHTNKSILSSDILESNNLGLALSTRQILDFTDTHPEYLKIKPQIEEKQIITGKGGWQRIAGCFIADSAYNYLLLGNFNSAGSTEYNVITDHYDLKLAYYFIDDVNLTQLPYNGVSLLNSSISFCHDQEFVEIDAFVEGALSYEWENGETNHRIRISERKTKDYTVKINFNECTYRYSFHVFYYPDIDLGQDTVLCDGEELLLQPQHPIKNYKWLDGSSDTFRIVSTPGIYSVSVSSPCTIDDSIEVKFLDCPGFIPNVITPNGDSYNPTLSFENLENRTWSLEIFNRWGTPVFFAKRYCNNWDGEGLTEGIYYYILKSTDLNKEVRGFVQIIRTVSR